VLCGFLGFLLIGLLVYFSVHTTVVVRLM